MKNIFEDRREKKIQALTNNINEFITFIKEKRKETIENGKKALSIDSKKQVDFWVVQYKATTMYEKQAQEVLGQLDIARYSKQMQDSTKQFFGNIKDLAKQIAKMFKYNSFNEIEDVFDDLENQNDEVNDLIEEATERFRTIQENSSNSSENINISNEERENIVKIFKEENKTVSTTDFLKKILG